MISSQENSVQEELRFENIIYYISDDITLYYEITG